MLAEPQFTLGQFSKTFSISTNNGKYFLCSLCRSIFVLEIKKIPQFIPVQTHRAWTEYYMYYVYSYIISSFN